MRTNKKNRADMMPHSWIIDCLDFFGIADNIERLLIGSMGRRKTLLAAGREVLSKVNINRGVFQGGELSPLLFVIALIP